MPELLNCPFCGATELERNDSKFWTGRENTTTRYRIQHHCKDVEGRVYRRIEVAGTTEAEMIAAWQARAQDSRCGDGDIAKLEAKIFDRLSRLERRSDNGTYMNIPAEISAGYLWETCQDIRLFLKYRHTAMQAASNAILAEKGEV